MAVPLVQPVLPVTGFCKAAIVMHLLLGHLLIKGIPHLHLKASKALLFTRV